MASRLHPDDFWKWLSMGNLAFATTSSARGVARFTPARYRSFAGYTIFVASHTGWIEIGALRKPKEFRPCKFRLDAKCLMVDRASRCIADMNVLIRWVPALGRLRPDYGLCQSITGLWTLPQRNDMRAMFCSRISTSWNAKTRYISKRYETGASTGKTVGQRRVKSLAKI
jgi:hypothetical protein